MKVYLLYKSTWDGGANGWDLVEGIYVDKDKAEWDMLQLEELHGDSYTSFYVEEHPVDESKFEDLK